MAEKPILDNKSTYEAIFDGMDKLAKHGFEYYLAGISAFILIAGIIMTPQEFLSEEELWVISGYGSMGLAGSLYVWRQKVAFKFRTNQEKIVYKMFKTDLITRNYEIAVKAASDRKEKEEKAALQRLEMVNKFASAVEKSFSELDDIK